MHQVSAEFAEITLLAIFFFIARITLQNNTLHIYFP